MIDEVVFSSDRRRKPEITRRPDGRFQVRIFREVPRDVASESEAYWSPVERGAILADSVERAKARAQEALLG